MLCRALYDFVGDDDKKVSFSKGDLLHYYGEAPSGGWARGKLIESGRKGFFPVSFVETLTGEMLQMGLDSFATVEDHADEDEKLSVQRMIELEKQHIVEIQRREKRGAVHEKINDAHLELERQASLEAEKFQKLAEKLLLDTADKRSGEDDRDGDDDEELTRLVATNDFPGKKPRNQSVSPPKSPPPLSQNPISAKIKKRPPVPNVSPPKLPVAELRRQNTAEMIFASLEKDLASESPEISPRAELSVSEVSKSSFANRQSEAIAYSTPMLPANDPLASVMNELKDSKASSSGWRIGGLRRPTGIRIPNVSNSIRINSLEMRIQQLEIENETLKAVQAENEQLREQLRLQKCRECFDSCVEQKRKKPLPVPMATMTTEVTEVVRTERKPLPIPDDRVSIFRPSAATMEVISVEQFRSKPLPEARDSMSTDSTGEIKFVIDERESVMFFSDDN